MSTPLDQPAPQLQSQATTMAQPSSPTTPDLQTLIEGLVHPNVVAPLEKKEDAKKEELPPDAVSPYHRLPPAGKYMLVAGDSIPCRLDQTVVSELPGKIYCTVDLDVRDSEENLLIPHGTRLQGSYQNRLAYGDSRLLQLWDRLIFPDKSSINLLLEVGTDPDGSTGLSGSLNRHYARMISNALLATVFAAGIAVTQRTNTSLIATPSVGNVVGQAAGAQIGQLVSEMGRQDIARSATFRLDPGALIHVPIGHDMVFDSPYTSYVTATANVLSDAR
jgi:type IV secretion system protein VirB10